MPSEPSSARSTDMLSGGGSPAEALSVLIADDEPEIRSSLSASIAAADDMVVAGTAADGRTAVQLATSLRPRIVLMDVRMPRVDGVEATVEILRAQPSTHVVMLVTAATREAVVPALRAGALSCVLKSDPPERLLGAVRRAVAGRPELPPEALEVVVGHLRDSSQRDTLPSTLRLTARESEVLRHLGRGLSNREIAQRLWVSERSVKLHVTNLVAKFQVRDRLQLVIAAHRAGLIQL